MRKVSYHVATTADGFIAHADGALTGFLMEGPHTDDFMASLSAYDTVLMGRETYELGKRYGVLSPYPGMRQIVFSARYAEPPHPDVRLVRSDAAGAVRELKSQPGGDIWLCGGARLAGTLFEAGLIDEVVLKVNPVVFGAGKPLFDGWRGERALKLVDSKRYDNGVVLQRYDVIKD